MKKTDKRALKTLASAEYESFEIEDGKGEKVTLYIYPLQLGRLALISERLLDLDFALENDAENDVKKMWQICSEMPDKVAEIIAIATLRSKEDIETQLRERTQLILNSPTMTANAVANVLMTIVFASYYGDFTAAIRSVKTLQIEVTQRTEAERIATTEEGHFGAKSMPL